MATLKSGFICPVCHYTAPSASALENHFATKHEDPTPAAARTLSAKTYTAPQFGYQSTCKICSSAFGIQKVRHHCRACGHACCYKHSTNFLSLPHLGYRSPVRVCDACFQDIMKDRLGTGVINSEGVMFSGKLMLAANSVLVKLSHISLNLFSSEVDMSGKLINSIHLSDIISIRRGPGSRSFTIGDTDGNTIVLTAQNDDAVKAWTSSIVKTKNELLDTVRLLGQAKNAAPQVRSVLCDDSATLGSRTIMITDNVGIRAPFRLPYMCVHEAASMTIYLDQGFLTLSASELLRLAQDPAASEEVDDVTNSQYWFEVKGHHTMDVISSIRNRRVHLKIEARQCSDQAELPVMCYFLLIIVSWFMGESWSNASSLENVSNDLVSTISNAFNVVQTILPQTNNDPTRFQLITVALILFMTLPCISLRLVSVVFMSSIAILSWWFVGRLLQEFGRYQNHMCTRFVVTIADYAYHDLDDDQEEHGTLMVQDDECPERFLRMVRGDHTQAVAFWNATKRWRLQNQPEVLLQRPHPHFSDVKKAFTHFYHKRDKLGRIVYYEVLDNPRVAFKDLAEKGISVDDVVQHMTFMNEFCYRHLNCDYDEEGTSPQTTGQLIKVMDIKSIGLGDVGGDVSDYFKKIGSIGKNYPERIDRILIVNVPAAFGMLWKIVAPMLDRNVRERITLHRSNYYDALTELIDPENIPCDYGGQCRCPGGCRFGSPEEKRFRAVFLCRSSRAKFNPK